MSFLPIGPDFVFGPRDPNFKRVSVRNEFGVQVMISQIAIDPTDANTIYVLARPVSGGAGLFRSDDGGGSWVSLLDQIQRAALNSARATAVVLNPATPNIVYMATDNSQFYVSTDRGSNWSGPTSMNAGGAVRGLIVDPRSSSNPNGTVIIAAAAAGVLVSTGGSAWSNVLPGNVTSVAASFAGASGGDYYATVFQSGLFHSTGVNGPWTNLSTQGIGLPPRGTAPNFGFDDIAVALCRANNRAYAWTARFGKTTGIFTATSPSTGWQAVAATSPPDPGQGLYSFGLGVAPNSPGDGANDILFFPGYQFFRSVDAGRTWENASSSYDAFHNDAHYVTFAPDPAPAGVIPATYLGCDGGIAVSVSFADPTVTLGTTTDFNEGDDYLNSEVLQSLNHGLHASGIYTYACDPQFPALSYIGSQDTAMAAGTGALGWRALDWNGGGEQEGDGFKAAVVAGSDGLKVWFYLGVPNYIRLVTDRGGFNNPETDCKLGGSGPLVVASSNMVVGLDGQCLVGGWLRDDSGNKLTAAIAATGVQAATPAAMSGITVGVTLAIEAGGANPEFVTVTATTNATFTANFAKTHAAGAGVQLQRFPIVRIDQSGTIRQVSQDFGPLSQPRLVAVHPTDPNTVYCITGDQRAWTTNNGASAGAGTVWTEITPGKPTDIGSKASIVGLSVDASGNAYVLCSQLVNVPGTGEFSGFDTPLLTINGNVWVGLVVTPNVPSGPFGLLLADPVQNSTLYASAVNRIFRVTSTPAGWDWSDISDGLPGAPINDMWAANIGTPATPLVLLRAATSPRGVFEADVTAGATDPAIALYLRANFLDLGRLPTPPSGVTSPFDGSTQVFHYQSADIKIDAQRPEGFFQTDPEAPLPLSHVIFDELLDNSENLPSTAAALVHVQVHNRSLKPANNVQVWVLYANASAGLPALPDNFVKNFLATGKISGSVASSSPWQPIGPPQTLNGITAGSPKVASWPWTIPTLAFGQPGHYCIAAFLHSAASPFGDPSRDVDDLAVRIKQVGQKNLHVGPPLTPFPFGASSAASGGGTPTSGGASGGPGATPAPNSARQHTTPAFLVMREYVEFHNPTIVPRQATLVFDFHELPPELHITLRLSRLTTSHALTGSISGAHERRTSLISHIAETIDRYIEDPIERFLKPVVDDIEDFFETLLHGHHHAKDRRHRRPTIPINPTIYDAQPGQVRIDGVVLGPLGAGAAEVTIRNRGTLEPGSEYWYQIQQWVGGKIVGGSIYKIRIAGMLQRLLIPTPELPDTVIANYPLWAEHQIEDERQRQMMQGD